MWRLALLALAACYHPAGEASCGVRCASNGTCPASLRCGGDGLCFDPNGSSCGGPSDAMPADDDVPTGTCYGNHLGVMLCDGDATPGTVSPPASIDTGNTAMCTFTRFGACVITGVDIDITSVTKVRGGLPIIFFAQHTLTIGGNAGLDAASHYANPIGPGGNDASCSASINGSAENATFGAGGAAGGTLQGPGGPGGNGASSNGAGSNSGQPDNPMTTLSALRGGCRGGDGGGCTSSLVGGLGGNGGGAVYLLAGESIAISGWVNASGGGAAPGKLMTACGGGGGGSGGAIVLDAPVISLNNAVLIASGGGGGGSYASGTASAGGDPNITMPTQAAIGGQGDPAGNGDGGGGSSEATSSGLNGVGGAIGSGHTGGGGGGGGAGFVYSYGGLVLSGNPMVVPGLSQNPL